MQSQSATNTNHLPNIVSPEEEPVFEIVNAKGAAPIVFVCEHASNRVPQYFAALGLGQQELESHIAWDPGAREIALALSAAFDAPLVNSKISRLVYDCNRPPESAGAIQAVSETTQIPGNKDISKDQAAARVEQVYRPFTRALKDTIAQKSADGALPVMITIHSFTPVYFGKRRDVQIGVLHDSDSRLANAMLTTSAMHTKLNVMRNMPYGPKDGVTHTLKEHGLKNGLINVMLEIRNDLVATSKDQQEMATMLFEWLKDALTSSGTSLEGVAPVNLAAKKE